MYVSWMEDMMVLLRFILIGVGLTFMLYGGKAPTDLSLITRIILVIIGSGLLTFALEMHKINFYL